MRFIVLVTEGLYGEEQRKKELKDGAEVIKITGPVRFDIFFRSEVK